MFSQPLNFYIYCCDKWFILFSCVQVFYWKTIGRYSSLVLVGSVSFYTITWTVYTCTQFFHLKILSVLGDINAYYTLPLHFVKPPNHSPSLPRIKSPQPHIPLSLQEPSKFNLTHPTDGGFQPIRVISCLGLTTIFFCCC